MINLKNVKNRDELTSILSKVTLEPFGFSQLKYNKISQRKYGPYLMFCARIRYNYSHMINVTSISIINCNNSKGIFKFEICLDDYM